jgi:uncharacterized protein YgbK (DUF1537 family)
MTQYAVIADDLTGAGDTGVQFSKAGLPTRILLDAWETGALAGAAVLVAQTASRGMAPQDAYKTVHAAASRLAGEGVRPLYKKVDSTLRGQIGAEIDAMMDVWDIPLALLCPAFPANKRTLVGGYLLVEGELVSRTPIGVDPVTPVAESHIPSLLQGQSRRAVHAVQCRDLALGRAHLAEVFRSLTSPQGAIVVADAVSEADLALLEAAMREAEPNALYVGSAGLALPVAARVAQSAASPLPVLAVVGSVNPVSRGQLKQLQSQGYGLFLLTGDELLADEAAWAGLLPPRVAELAQRLREGRDTALITPGEREEVAAILAKGAALGLDSKALTDRVAARVTGLAAEALKAIGTDGVSGLILTGGDMAQGLLRHFGATGITLLSEVSPGIPVGRIEGQAAGGLKIVTKAGGFGAPDALVKASVILRESTRAL